MSDQPSFKELSAEIRNKLQTVKTTLEFLKNKREVSEEFLARALEDLVKIEEALSVD